MITNFDISGRTVLFSRPNSSAKMLVIHAGSDNKDEDMNTLESIRKFLNPHIKKGVIPDFYLLSVSSPDWDTDYSPWEENIDGTIYKGLADNYFSDLKEILSEITDNTEVHFTKENIIFAGYSLAGLASLYGLLSADIYMHSACVSGSLWYPGWIDFLKENIKSLDRDSTVYISLGSKETKTRNVLMRENGNLCEESNALLVENGINSIYQVNNGNHFYEPDRRVARGIFSLLTHNSIPAPF